MSNPRGRNDILKSNSGRGRGGYSNSAPGASQQQPGRSQQSQGGRGRGTPNTPNRQDGKISGQGNPPPGRSQQTSPQRWGPQNPQQPAATQPAPKVLNIDLPRTQPQNPPAPSSPPSNGGPAAPTTPNKISYAAIATVSASPGMAPPSQAKQPAAANGNPAPPQPAQTTAPQQNGTTVAPGAPAASQPRPIAQPQPQNPPGSSTFQNGSPNFTFARTQSAPPNLEEQQAKPFAPVHYMPEKVTPMQFFPAPPFHYANFVPRGMPGNPMQHMPMGYPPMHIAIPHQAPVGMFPGPIGPIPGPQHMPPQQFQPPVPATSQRKALSIVDPETGQAVSLASPPKQRPPAPSTAQNTQNPGMMPTIGGPKPVNYQPSGANNVPGGILPEIQGMMVPQNQSQARSTLQPRVSKALAIVDPADVEAAAAAAKQAKETTTTNKEQEKPAAEVSKQAEPSSKETKVASPAVPPAKEIKEPAPATAVVASPVAEKVDRPDAAPKEEEAAEEEKPIEAITVQKKKRKDLLKKANDGNYKAASFDPYLPQEEKKEEKPKETEVKKEEKSKAAPAPEIEEEEEESDDDWENKNEDELVNGATTESRRMSTSQQSRLSDSGITPISYPPNQWSPFNTSGKQVYERNFMEQFKSLCTDKPELKIQIQDIEVPTQNWNKGGAGIPRQPSRDFKNQGGQQQQYGNRPDRDPRGGQYGNNFGAGGSGGNYNNQYNNSPRTGRMQREVSNQGGSLFNKNQRGGGGGQFQKRTMSNVQLSNEPPVAPLQSSADRWEPSRRERVSGDEVIIRRVKSLLNKITEETFDRLTEKLVNIGVKDSELVSEIIRLIFEKALLEPKFSKMYAELCKVLNEKIPDFHVEGRANGFKRLLLNRCQTEFEAISTKEKEKPADNLTREERITFEENQFMAKKKMLGNITFIAELFKIQMLSQKIMHQCIQVLLMSPEPTHDYIEALCKLMAGIGAQIDKPEARNWMDQYFERIRELSKSPELPSRLRFMLEATLTLRENKWLTRKEAKEKAPAAITILKNSSGSSGRGGPTSANRNVSSPSISRPPPRQPSGNYDEWTVVGKGQKQQYRPTDEPTFSMRNSSEARKIEKSASRGDVSAPAREIPAASEVTGESNLSEEMESKIEMIFAEYFTSSELSEAIECVNELHLIPQLHADLVSKAILLSLEKKDKERDLIAKLLPALSKQKGGIISSEHFAKGLQTVLSMLDDLSIDIPQAPSIVAAFVGLLLLEDCMTLSPLESDLKNLVESTSNSSQAAHFIAEIWSRLKELADDSRLREVYENSGIELANYLPAEERNNLGLVRFLEKKDLAAVLLHVALEAMFRENLDKEIITKWIEEHAMDDAFDDPIVVRRIFKSITRHSNEEKQRDSVRKYAEILRMFTGSLPTQVAIVTELHQNTPVPKGPFMERWLTVLLENDVIARQAVTTWEQDKKDQSLGKREAVQQLSSKFLSSMRN
eukprot:TRINITY_DN1447_c0_g2_i1.p1 TRINITY_DN1447_c0_g2~~TRINITY_DN1447_c0_g2_i1.p1  ORF type:complete len:1464 (+),score=477.86 TRINITY_DN1447_c0_g2_i1:192-4583(+)